MAGEDASDFENLGSQPLSPGSFRCIGYALVNNDNDSDITACLITV